MITAYRYGSPRRPKEGLRLGTTRHVPRGVRREDWRKKNYFDLWLPLLAPSADLVKSYLCKEITYSVFTRQYRRQMRAPACRQVIGLLALLSWSQPLSVGCFCEDESRCHRSILKKLIETERKRSKPSRRPEPYPEEEIRRLSSPVCYARAE